MALDAEVRMLDAAGAQDLRDDVLHGVGRHREPDADVAGADAAGLDLRVDADDLASSSSRGPPELPLLIGASVWMTWSMVNWFGAVMSRCTALTMPAVAVRSSPKGLPIATTGSPTSTLSEFPSGSGVSAFALTFTRRTARSVDGSVPTSFASTVSRLEKLTVTSSAPSTTW